MPIRRSVRTGRAATPIEQAMWTLAAVPLGVAVPLLLHWMIGGVAEAGRGRPGAPAAATRMALRATGELVHWVGVGVLTALVALCVVMAGTYLRDARRSRGIPAWAVAETYAVGAVAALAGLIWLL